MTPARGVEDVKPGIVNPGGPPLPPADMSAGGHPRKKRKEKEGGRLATPELPPHPVVQMSTQELQEHRDAILQQQMLGRQLLSELTRRHITKHHQ